MSNPDKSSENHSKGPENPSLSMASLGAGSLRVPLTLSFFAGIMVPLGFDPWGLSFLMPFAFMLLALATDRCGFRRSLLLGWVFGLGVQGASLPWIALAAKNYLGIFVLGDPGSWTAWLSGIGLFILWWPLSSLGWGFCMALVSMAPEAPGSRQRIWKCLGVFIFVALYEQYWPRLFPWSIGSGLATAEPSAGWILLRQWGSEVASLVIVATGFLAAHIFPLVIDLLDRRQRQLSWSRIWLLIPCLLVACLTLLPLPESEMNKSVSADEDGVEDGVDDGVIVSLIQPAIPLEQRHGRFFAQLSQEIRSLVEVAQRSVVEDESIQELMILPEGSIPGLHDSSTLVSWASSWLEKPLLAGVMYEAPEGIANAAALLTPQSEIQGLREISLQVGFKKDLVPFGERIPGEALFDFVGWKPPIASLLAGEKPIVFNSLDPESPFGVSICYEGLLPMTSPGLQSEGALWHVNITEDLWYGDFVEPAQHLQLQRSRSIESNLPLLRCTNAGHTVAFDPQGFGLQTLTSCRSWSPSGGWTEWQSLTEAGEFALADEIGLRGILQVKVRKNPKILQGPYLLWPKGWAPILALLWVLIGCIRLFRSLPRLTPTLD